MKKNENFFHFFIALIEIWLQNQTERIISGIRPTFFVWIRLICENKNLTSSGYSHCFSVNFWFFGHFRLPEVIETPTKPQFQPFPSTCKRVWVSSLNCLAVRGRPDSDYRKSKVVKVKFFGLISYSRHKIEIQISVITTLLTADHVSFFV